MGKQPVVSKPRLLTQQSKSRARSRAWLVAGLVGLMLEGGRAIFHRMEHNLCLLLRLAMISNVWSSWLWSGSHTRFKGRPGESSKVLESNARFGPRTCQSHKIFDRPYRVFLRMG